MAEDNLDFGELLGLEDGQDLVLQKDGQKIEAPPVEAPKETKPVQAAEKKEGQVGDYYQRPTINLKKPLKKEANPWYLEAVTTMKMTDLL